MQEDSPLISQLIDSINDSLTNHLPSNATFLCERLLAEKDTEETRNMLAECYLAEGKTYKIQQILHDCRSPQNRQLFALSCQKLNKIKEAENCFKDGIPNGCYGHQLLGLINEKKLNFKDAQKQQTSALEINPTLQVAYEKLCKLGTHVKDLPTEKIFNENRQQNQNNNRKSTKLESQTTKMQKNENEMIEEQKEHTFNSHQEIEQEPLPPMQKESMVGSSILNIPGKSRVPIKKQLQIPSKTNITSKEKDEEKSKKSSIGKAPSFGQYFIDSNKKKGSMEKNQQKLITQKKQINNPPITDIMILLKMLADPIALMSEYQCLEAIEHFKLLPESQFQTSWVLNNIGRCYMEMIKYPEAETQFADAYRREPYRLEGLEQQSSCLWHLKKQIDSCYLAYEALEKSIFAPEAWIAVGNCFSLQKEHENALKFFNRAIQLNPNNPYPHTLCGHEQVYGEDFQKAKKCFETALSLDLRHYNAWWGLGNINYKQEKYDQAIKQFQTAININPRCPILQSYLGMTFSCKREFAKSIEQFDIGEKLDNTCLLNKYQKANVLVQLEQFPQALSELEKLRLLMPKEAPIPILMGKIQKKLGNISKAQFQFTLALDLDQKDAQKIKGYIEGLHNNNEFNDEFDY